jgi:hypothetical protein
VLNNLKGYLFEAFPPKVRAVLTLPAVSPIDAQPGLDAGMARTAINPSEVTRGIREVVFRVGRAGALSRRESARKRAKLDDNGNLAILHEGVAFASDVPSRAMTLPTTILRTQSGVLDEADEAVLAALRARLAAAPCKVLLHLHGGLVDQAHGEAIAARLSGRGPLAFNAPQDWEQVYVVWRTGAFETLREGWLDLASNDRLYRALLRKLLGHLAKALIPLGGGRTAGASLTLGPAQVAARLESGVEDPFGDVDALLAGGADAGRGIEATQSDLALREELSAELQGDPEFMRASADIAAALAAPEAGPGTRGGPGGGDAAAGERMLDRLDSEPRAALMAVPAEAAGRGLLTSAAVIEALVLHAWAIADRVLRRFRTGRDHGFQATIVEELVRELWGDIVGSAVWGAMKEHAADHFAEGRLGVDLLNDLTSRSDHRLLVTAHSAGAIWATELLRAASARRAPPRFDIAFLAPAVRMRLLAEVLQSAAPHIRRIRLFAMKDALERADAVLGPGTAGVYPSSLLYLVTGLFETDGGAPAVDPPLLGMQRYLKGDQVPTWLAEPSEHAANGDVRAFLTANAGAAWFSKDNGGPGCWTEATSHGAFDSEQRTLESVATMFA